MKIRLLLLASVFVAVPWLRSEDTPAAPPPAAAKPAHADEDETELGGKMDKMSRAFRALRKQVADPAKNASSLELVATMRAAAEDAIKLIPAKAADIPEADRAKFVADYQAKMKSFLDEVAKLETALKDNKNDEAVKLVDALNTMQKEGHKEFRRPKKG